MNKTDEGSAENDFRPISSIDEVTDEEILTIKIKRPISVIGSDQAGPVDRLQFRFPTMSDMAIINKAKDSEAKMLEKLSVDPPLSPDDIGRLAQSDFALIILNLQNSGFFGLVRG